MKEFISEELRAFLGYSINDSEKEIEKSLKKRLSFACKPCWELKYCPVKFGARP